MKRGKILLFEKKQKNLFISSDSRRKGTKEDCYLQAPYIGGCKQRIDSCNSLWVLVSRDDGLDFLIIRDHRGSGR